MQKFYDFLEGFTGNIDSKYYDLIDFFVLAFMISVASLLTRKLIILRLRGIFKKSKNDLDDLFIEITKALNWAFIIPFAILISARVTNLQDFSTPLVQKIMFLIIVLFGVRIIIKIVNYLFKKVLSTQREKVEDYDPTMLRVLKRFVGAVVWIITILFVLQNYGYNVSTIIGGLGIAGIAIAFGLQSILEDIFSFFTIYFDKPFKIGDFIVIGKDMGTVKKIGIKSTRIKTLQGQEIILSNKELTQSRINNYRYLRERRVEFQFTVGFKTTPAKLKALPDQIGKVIDKVENVEFKRAHLKNIGGFGYEYEVVFIVKDSDYVLYMDVRQKINLAIVELLEKEGIKLMGLAPLTASS